LWRKRKAMTTPTTPTLTPSFNRSNNNNSTSRTRIESSNDGEGRRSHNVYRLHIARAVTDANEFGSE
jgi:hypothetical protein